jgi:hypothetical protein
MGEAGCTHNRRTLRNLWEVSIDVKAMLLCATLSINSKQNLLQGAKSGGEEESAQAKNAALKAAGAIVPTSFEGLEEAIKSTYDALVAEGTVTPAQEVQPPVVPEDLKSAIKAGKVRAPTHIVSTICDDRGMENEKIEKRSGRIRKMLLVDPGFLHEVHNGLRL